MANGLLSTKFYPWHKPLITQIPDASRIFNVSFRNVDFLSEPSRIQPRRRVWNQQKVLTNCLSPAVHLSKQGRTVIIFFGFFKLYVRGTAMTFGHLHVNCRQVYTKTQFQSFAYWCSCERISLFWH